MTFIAKIFLKDRLEILAANNLVTLGEIVGGFLLGNVPLADLPVKIEFSVQK